MAGCGGGEFEIADLKFDKGTGVGEVPGAVRRRKSQLKRQNAKFKIEAKASGARGGSRGTRVVGFGAGGDAGLRDFMRQEIRNTRQYANC